MSKFDTSAVAYQLTLMINAAFKWTNDDQYAVANFESNKIVLHINGQTFDITVKERKKV